MANSNEYMREYMKRRYHQRRAYAIDKLGGKCVKCGETEQLEIDHTQRGNKEVDFGKVWSYSKIRFEEELLFCQLLCHDCHKAKSAEEMSVPHGGGLTGKRNCKCGPCKERKREYAREWKRHSKMITILVGGDWVTVKDEG